MPTIWPRYLDAVFSVVALTLAFYPLEYLRPAEATQRFQDRVVNYLHLPFILAWALALQQILGPWHTYLLRMARGGLLFSFLEQSKYREIVMTVVFAVTWDIWQYWIHRAQHAFPVLWETHKFHHSETALNTSTQARHHASSYVVYMIGYAPMLVFVGISAPHALVAALMFRVWGFVNHANVRLTFGRLTVVVAGPQWHRIHHSVYPEHFDKNFAAFFPFIDRLFGTYYEPAQNEYPETGLPEASPSDLEQATTAPFAGWYRSMKGLAKNLTNQSKPTAA